jgi:hypothetical protein
VVASYSHAGMRHAMESGRLQSRPRHPRHLSWQVGKYAYTIQKKDGQSLYTVTDGSDSLTLPIRWMFGQHSQTWVLEKDGHSTRAWSATFPRSANGLDTTPGDDKLACPPTYRSHGPQAAHLGDAAVLPCHATGAVDGAKLTLDKLKPGLDCEHCHVGSELHLADAANDNFKTLPAR